MKTLLAISPHLDDAIFSAGATLWYAAQGGWRVVVATVFTGNVAQPQSFALACQLDKDLAPEVEYMALRRAEDVEACSAISAEPRHLPLLEAPHRGYADAAALFGNVREDDHAGGQVGGLLAALMDELRPDRLLGPLGIGGHVDHLIVRDTLARTAGATPLSWWEDWPYLDRAGKIDRTHVFAHSLADEGRAAKVRACMAYRTQLQFQFGGPAGLAAALAVRTTEHLHDLLLPGLEAVGV